MATKNIRSISNIQGARRGARDISAPISEPSTPRVMEAYAAIISAIPSTQRGSTAVRVMALEMAEAVGQTERCAAVLARDGDFFTTSSGDIKPHPAAAIRHAAAVRIGQFALRLRLTPSGDARELQRAASFESTQRGHAELSLPAAPDGPAPDWVSKLRAEK